MLITSWRTSGKQNAVCDPWVLHVLEIFCLTLGCKAVIERMQCLHFTYCYCWIKLIYQIPNKRHLFGHNLFLPLLPSNSLSLISSHSFNFFSFWLQRPTRGRHSSLHSTWRRSPKWRKRWALDHPHSPRARSSQASLPLSARMGQRGLQQLQSAQGHWNQGKEAQWLRTACWARISTLRWPLSCWLSFQVGCVRTVSVDLCMFAIRGKCKWALQLYRPMQSTQFCHSSKSKQNIKSVVLKLDAYVLNLCKTVYANMWKNSHVLHRSISKTERATRCVIDICGAGPLSEFQISQ